jgi:hypothetical protein
LLVRALKWGLKSNSTGDIGSLILQGHLAKDKCKLKWGGPEYVASCVFYCRWVYNLFAIIYMLLSGSQQFFCLWSSYASPHKNGSQLESLGLSFRPLQAGRYYFQLFFSLAFLIPSSILWFVLAELRLPTFIGMLIFQFLLLFRVSSVSSRYCRLAFTGRPDCCSCHWIHLVSSSPQLKAHSLGLKLYLADFTSFCQASWSIQQGIICRMHGFRPRLNDRKSQLLLRLRHRSDHAHLLLGTSFIAWFSIQMYLLYWIAFLVFLAKPILCMFAVL